MRKWNNNKDVPRVYDAAASMDPYIITMQVQTKTDNAHIKTCNVCPNYMVSILPDDCPNSRL